MLELALLPILMVLNRVRGGGFWADRLPGHPRYYVTPLLGILSYIVTLNPLTSLAYALSYLFWSILPWGRWFDLGHMDTLPDRKVSIFEQMIEKVTKNDYAAFTLRNVVGWLPATIFLSPLASVLACAQTAIYAFGWYATPKWSIAVSELLTGLLWAILLIGVHHGY